MLFLIALAAGGAVYFTINWVMLKRHAATLTELERRNIEITEQMRRRRRANPIAQLRASAAVVGWGSDLTPLVAVAGLIYLLCVLAVGLVGLPVIPAVICGLPLAAGVAWLIFNNRVSRRRKAFAAQLTQTLELLSSQVKTGSSAPRSLDEILPSLPEPMRTEMARVVEQTRAARPLAEAMAEVANRYPSRAMTMFVAALAIDRARGGSITGALDRAAEMIRTQDELISETKAELAQERAQFIGIVAIVGAICVYMFTVSGASEQLLTPIGLTAMAIGAANFAFGVARTLRMFAKAGEGL